MTQQIEDEIIGMVVAAKAQQDAAKDTLARLQLLTDVLVKDRQLFAEETKGMDKAIADSIKTSVAASVSASMAAGLGAHKKALEGALSDAEARVKKMGSTWVVLGAMGFAGLIGAGLGSVGAYFALKHEHVVTVETLPYVHEQTQQPQQKKLKKN